MVTRVLKAAIICGGQIEKYEAYMKILKQSNFVVCADGGARHLAKLGIEVDVLIGDFDSISSQDMRYLESRAIVKKLAVKKDKTDSEAAIDIAVERGVDEIAIIGGLGGRLDHSLSNMMLLKYILDKGKKGVVVSDYSMAWITDENITLHNDNWKYVSLIPLTSEVRGINTTGLYYPLVDETLKLGSSRGVSNEFISNYAQISISDGLLLVIVSNNS